MISNSSRVLAALAASLLVIPAATAEARAATTVFGGPTAGVFNRVSAGMSTGTAPVTWMELDAQGCFLSESFDYYRVRADASTSSRTWRRSGTWEMRVDGMTVRSGDVSVAGLAPKAAHVTSLETSYDYIVSVGGLPVDVRGAVRVDLVVSLRYAFGGSLVFPASVTAGMEGTIAGHPTGTVSAVVTGPYAGVATVGAGSTIDFGRQQLTGRIEAGVRSAEAALDYDLSTMKAFIVLCASMAGVPLGCAYPTWTSSPGRSVTPFL